MMSHFGLHYIHCFNIDKGLDLLELANDMNNNKNAFSA